MPRRITLQSIEEANRQHRRDAIALFIVDALAFAGTIACAAIVLVLLASLAGAA